MKIALITTYVKTIDEIVIHNGFSYGYDLFPEDSTNIFVELNEIENKIDTYKKLLCKYDKIFCSLCSTSDLILLDDLIDDRWVIGGPITLVYKYINNKEKYNFYLKSIPEYFGVKEYNYHSNFNVYFKPLLHILNSQKENLNKTIKFTANIGGNCSWSKCTFCSHTTIMEKRLHGEDMKYLLKTLENEIPEGINPTVVLCTPAVSKRQLETLIEFQTTNTRMKFETLMIPSKFNTKTLKTFDDTYDCSNIIFQLGLEVISEEGLKFYNKSFCLQDVLDCCKEINRLNGTIELLLMDNYVTTKREDIETTRWFLDELMSFVDIKNILPFRNAEPTQWLYDKWDWVLENSDFGLIDYDEYPLIDMKISDIPPESEVYKYNEIIRNMILDTYNYIKEKQNE